MKDHIRDFIYDWMPSAVIRSVKSLLASIRTAPYEFIGHKWPVNVVLRGWQANGVNKARETTWKHFSQSMEGTHPLGISETDLFSHHQINTDVQSLYLSFGYCLGLACHRKEALKVLDWGGGTGNYYIISRKLFPMVKFDYSSADLPSICKTGRTLLPNVTFYEDNSWYGKNFDFVFSSSSIQYLKDWRPTLRALIQSTCQYLYITRMPFVTGRSFVFVERAKGYNTEYLGWAINKPEFVSFVKQNGMKLVREFVNHPGPLIKGAPERNLYMGLLFEK